MRSNNNLFSKTLTFILALGQGKQLYPITRERAKPLVPFGGVFRIIDFTLANCANSGLERAYLLTQYESHELHRYVQSVASKTNLVCLPSRRRPGYCGTANAVFENIDRIQGESSAYVLVLAADHVYKMDYRKLLRFHASHGGDVTIAAAQYPRRLAHGLGILDVNDDGRIVGFEEKPQQPKSLHPNSSKALANMGIYVFKASTLRRALLIDAASDGTHDFGKDVIPNLVRNNRVFAYNFTGCDDGLASYWQDVGTIDTYHRAHMQLLLVNSPFDPYNDARWPIHSGGLAAPLNRLHSEPSVVDSIVCSDSNVSGARIVESVLSSDVEVAPSAEVVSSVLMRGVRVGRGARVRRAIIEEGVHIPDGTRIGVDPAEDSSRFLVTENGIAVVVNSPTEKKMLVRRSSGAV